VAWAQLPSLKSGAHWTIQTAREYLSFSGEDPWADYWKARQRLAAAIKRLTAA
jgi:bifunctional non-homologous end joining protein LigD